MAYGYRDPKAKYRSFNAGREISLNGFMLLEFLIYSVLVVGIMGSISMGGIYLSSMYQRVARPLMERLAVQRIMACIERDLLEGVVEAVHWQSGEGVIGYRDSSKKVMWRLQKNRLWYEREDSRVPVLDGVLDFVSTVHVKKGVIERVEVELRGGQVEPICLCVIPRKVVIACIVS